MKRRKRKPLVRPKKIPAWLRHPKAGLYFVVVCLFFVALNWTIQRNTWVPMQVEPVEVPEALPTATEVHPQAWNYFHPVWKASQPLMLEDTLAVGPRSGNVSEERLRQLLQDPNGKLEPDFRVTSGLQERVLFWMRIHTQYDSHTRVIHDRNRPSIIYGVADFSPIYKESESAGQALTRVYRLERQIISEIKKRFSEAANLQKTKNLSGLERQQIRDFLSRHGALGPTEAAILIASIRSQTGQRDEFLLALQRSENLLPYIEATLRSYGLPVALARIPFVESSFNARAHSRVGATGIWQFMPVTARQMISSNPTLWSDPLRQTRAAARMMIIYRSMLPDWSTTVTAYNSGPGRLQRLAHKYQTKNVEKLLETQDPTGLGFAGKNFYAQFLSANLVEAYQQEIFQGAQEKIQEIAQLARP